ncbi:hypothetical protein BJ322DRAFT_887153 [Thelephora terrestris]|uniref:Uncharacterized protein n=1 Tax=Thelephora terrestris TaxID=56493 RepID=A0A9P6L5T8_9AGAM|nr:hypothetical protein BJ322DRAFT_887153 [Thelephora terrestris]
MLRLTPAEVELIETIAKEQLRYENIISAQAEFLRTDPPNFEAAMAWQVQQSPLVANRGQRWGPAQGDVDQYLAQCKDICELVPQSFEDRVKIMHGACGALMCLLHCKIAEQPEHVQSAISKRHRELTLPASAVADVDDRQPSPPAPIPSDRQSPPPKPAVEPRRTTAEDLRSFKLPENLHGKRFTLSPDAGDSGTYEVIGYRRERDNSVTYELLFEDCEDPIETTAEEMENWHRYLRTYKRHKQRPVLYLHARVHPNWTRL